MTPAVGIIGLGIMGGAFGANLVKAGQQVFGYDVSADAAAQLNAADGKALGSMAEVLQSAPITITSLPTVAAFNAVFAEMAPLLQAGNSVGHIVIDTCTMPLEVKEAAYEKLQAVGAHLLDCPVSGTGAQAAKKDLVVLGSGDAEAFEKARSTLEGMSRKQLYLGAFGKGSKMKYIANLLVNIHNVAAAEAFTLANKAGLDLQSVYDTLQDSAGSSRMFQMRGPLMVADNYQPPSARISLHMKDLDIISRFADGLHCPVPLFNIATQLYHAASSQGMGAEDTAAVCRVLEQLAGVERGA